MTTYTYDLVVIGGGPAGSTAASTAAQAGHRVALIERDTLGGTCHNYGCDPTKTLLHVAHLRYQAGHAERYGLALHVPPPDWAAVHAWVQQVLRTMEGGSYAAACKTITDQGIDLLIGDARFVSPHAVMVGEHTITAKHVLIATGTDALVPDIPGLADTGFITNVEAVALPTLPKRLAVLGGGALGSEFAQLFHRFGVVVTVIEQSDTLLPKEDAELSDRLATVLRAEGVQIELSATLTRVVRTDTGIRVAFSRAGHPHVVTVDQLLVALGRTPRINDLNLEAIGVETTPHGIAVDATLRSNVPHIWAAGDIASAYPFTHTADAQGQWVAQNIFTRAPRPFNTTAIPWATYTDPELARVGKTEAELRQDGVAYRVGRATMDDNERAVATGQTAGVVKVLVGRDGMLLGGHVLAAHGGELIAPMVLAMRHGLAASALADTLLPYPTLSEAVRQACQDAVAGDAAPRG